MNVLLIEDDHGIAELIRLKLIELSLDVRIAYNCEDSISILQKYETDLMILDYSLPDYNGNELVNRLNQLQINTPPFIVTTGQGDERIAVEMMKLGARDYIIKDNHFLNKIPTVVERVIREIENNKKYEEVKNQLDQSQQEFKAYFDNNPSSIFVWTRIDNDFILSNINETAQKITNNQAKDFLQMKASKIYNDLPIMIEKLNHCYESKTSFEFENYYKSRFKGEYDWIRFKFAYSEPNKVLLFSDVITEHKKNEIEVTRLKLAIEQSPVSVIITNIEGNIEYVNSQVYERSGYKREEIIGKNPGIFSSYMLPKENSTELWNTITNGNTWTGEFLNKKPDGELYWENAVIAPIKNSFGEITGYIAVKENITEKKKLWNDLIKEKNKAQESDRLKTAFLQNISHEIRTPLNGVIGFSEMLIQKNVTDEKRELYAEFVNKSSEQLLNIVNNILDISLIESDALELSYSEVDLNEISAELYSTFKSQAEIKNIDLRINNSNSSEHHKIMSDKFRLNQIIGNLINNAIKFTMEGWIEFGFSKNNNEYLFHVIDTGTGISKEHIDIIFERFVQENMEMTRKFGGTGLGLTISKKLIEKLGGNIWVESEKEKGSKFQFTLPIGPTS